MSIILLIVLNVYVTYSQVICGGTCVGREIWGSNCYCIHDSGAYGAWPAIESWCQINFQSNRTGEGHQVSIHSQAEWDYVKNKLGYFFYWIGLSEPSPGPLGECSWSTLEWSDGSPTDFQFGVGCYRVDDPLPRQIYYDIRAQNPLDGDGDGWGLLGMCKYELYCFDIWAGETDVCNGRGTCYSDNICTCDGGYFGEQCETHTCFLKYSNDTSVCSGRGNCTDINDCLCKKGWSGEECSIRLDGLCENPSDRNGGYCYSNLGSGQSSYEDSELLCNQWVNNVDSHLVSIHNLTEENFVDSKRVGSILLGLKKYPDGQLYPCPPDFGYDWSDNSLTDYAESQSVDCDSNELCIVYTSSRDWIDSNCTNSTYLQTLEIICKYKIPICYGYYSYEVGLVCSGNGQCVSENNCSCGEGSFGSNCELYECYGFFNSDENRVCSGKGTCIFEDNCECDEGYLGDECNITSCFGFIEGTPGVCSGNGECVASDICVCDPYIAGDKCEIIGGCNNTFDLLFFVNNEWTCYLKPNGTGMTFHGAEKDCNEWNGLPDGHLISVNSAEEYDLLWTDHVLTLDTDFQQVWLGLEKKFEFTPCTTASPTDFKWTDGSSTDFFILNHRPDCNVSAETHFILMDGVVYDIVSNYYYWAHYTTFTQHACKRRVPKCFGIDSFRQETCSNRGICYDWNTCWCNDRLRYFGENCNITLCDFEFSNDSKIVCSGHGTCWPHDFCSCDSNYYDQFCQVTTCEGILSNDTKIAVCNGHGICKSFDKCNCDEGYLGATCNISTCEGIPGNETDNVCHGHGKCIDLNMCDCIPSNEYFGDDCEHTKCNGINSNSKYPRVCKGKGTCWPFDVCQCDEGYFGVDCADTTCNGIFSNESDVCFNGHGICWPSDRCSCVGPPYNGPFCEISHPCTSEAEHVLNGYCYKNFGKMGNWNESETVCNQWFDKGHLVSINSSEEESWVDTYIVEGPSNPMFVGCLKNKINSEKLYPCPLSGGYIFSDGSSDNYFRTTAVTCSSNESCIVMESGETYKDVDCQSSIYDAGCKYKIPTCHGVLANAGASEVCMGHGYCFRENNCTCYDDSSMFNTGKYFGRDCNMTKCDGISSKDSLIVCSGKGTCWPYDFCDCDSEYDGKYCDLCKNEDEGYYGVDCNEFFNTFEATLNVNESQIFFPYQVPLDIAITYTRRSDNIFDNKGFPCGERIKNWEEYLGGPSNWPEALCFWKVSGDDDDNNNNMTEGIIYQINHDSLIYDPVPDGQRRVHDFDIHLCSKPRNVTMHLIREGAIIAPTPPDDDDGDGNVGGVIVGAVAGGLAAGLLALIITGGICGGILTCCLLCCTLIILMFITLVISCGVFLLVCCSGATAATTTTGAVVVGKEVHDEVMDEGTDLVKEAVKERWKERQDGGKEGLVVGEDGDVELDLICDDEGPEKNITDNLQEALRQKDEEFIDQDEGLDVVGSDGSDTGIMDENDSDGGIGFGSSSEDEEELEFRRKREEEMKRKENERKEKERKKIQKISEEEEKIKNFRVDKKMEKIREEITKERMGLSLKDTRYSQKRGRKVEQRLKGIEKDLKKEERKMIKKMEKKKGKGLDLKSFEKRKKKEEELKGVSSRGLGHGGNVI